MPVEHLRPHSCAFCASLVLSFGSYPASGALHVIGEFRQKVFLFELGFNEAIIGARRGCLFMSWVTALQSAYSGSQLRGALSEYTSGVINIFFEWVQEVDETVLDDSHPLTVCAVERYEPIMPTFLLVCFILVI
jgi:hypothetical protein